MNPVRFVCRCVLFYSSALPSEALEEVWVALAEDDEQHVIMAKVRQWESEVHCTSKCGVRLSGRPIENVTDVHPGKNTRECS